MLLVSVDAGFAYQADEMEGAVAFACSLHGFGDGWEIRKFIVGDEEVDARDVHGDYAAGAEVQVTDFAVAHLAVGKANEVLCGADKGVGVFREELVVGGLAGESDGVGFGLWAVAPSVEDGQDERAAGG